MYYGVSGHGKGLVDAMSAFGAKGPLRRAVICNDFQYSSADEITNMLAKLFKSDEKKKYFTIDEEITAEL